MQPKHCHPLCHTKGVCIKPQGLGCNDNHVYVQYSTTIVDLRRWQVMLPCHGPGTKYTVPSPN